MNHKPHANRHRSWLNMPVGLVWLLWLAACQTEKRLPPPVLAPVPGDGLAVPLSGSVRPGVPPAATHSQNPTAPPASETNPNQPPTAPQLPIPSAGPEAPTSPGNSSSGWRPSPTSAGDAVTREPVPRADPSNQMAAVSDDQQWRIRAERIFHRLLQTQSPAGPVPHLLVVPQPEPLLRSQPPDQVIVSLGLLRQCRTDGELATVLSFPLARLLQQPGPASPVLDRPPPDVPIGPESSTYGELPPWRQAELVKTGHARRQPVRVPSRDPILLARQMVLRAGYSDAEFERGSALVSGAGYRP
jgi:hypothetical protein